MKTFGLRPQRQSCMLWGKLFWFLLMGLSLAASAHQNGAQTQPTLITANQCAAAIYLAKSSRQLAEARQLQAALARATMALALAEQTCGPDHRDTIFILDDLAALNFRLNQLDLALEYAKRAIAKAGKQFGASTTDYAFIAQNLASIYYKRGDYQKAEPLYRQAFQTFRQAHNQLLMAQTASNLGRIYNEMSDLTRAQVFFQHAIAIYLELHGEYSATLARARLDAAGVCLRMEDDMCAWEAAQNAWQVFAEQDPLDHADLAAAAIMMARVEIYRSELKAAAERLRKTLKDLEVLGMQNSLRAAAAYHYVGFIHILKGETPEALRVYQHELLIYREALGEHHPAVGRTLHSLAMVYQNLGTICRICTALSGCDGLVDGQVWSAACLGS